MVYSARCAVPAYCFCNTTAKHVTKKSNAKKPHGAELLHKHTFSTPMYVCSLSACQLRVHCTIRPALHLCSGSSCALFQVCGCSSHSFPAGGDVSSGRFGTPCVVLGCWEVVQVLAGVLCTWEPHQQAVRCGKCFQGTERDIGISHWYLVYSVCLRRAQRI